jgi:hypothetical protein
MNLQGKVLFQSYKRTFEGFSPPCNGYTLTYHAEAQISNRSRVKVGFKQYTSSSCFSLLFGIAKSHLDGAFLRTFENKLKPERRSKNFVL